MQPTHPANAEDSGSSPARLSAEATQQALERETQRRREAELALQARERELTDFVENAVEGLHKVDQRGIILWANRAELSMLGYEPEEYIGRSIADFHVDKPVIDDILQRLLGGGIIYDQRARLRCKDGSIKHVSIHSNGCFQDGALKYTRCYTRDASLMHERDQLMEELASASRAKDEFLAMLGHELRNPLAPIVTALALMRMRGDTKTAHEQGIIERQVKHLVRLVDDLLDVSRITRGKIELRSERVELSEVLTKAVEMAGLLLEQRQHRLVLDVAPLLQWEGDPARLAQVVSNLLTNAARYTNVGGEVLLRAWQPSPGELAISVRDNGIGIAPDQLPKLFELFFQAKQSIDRPEGGLGIGLALVKNLVEMHGGTVQAFSEGLGRGSEFMVRLPIRPPTCEALPVATRAEEAAQQAPQPGDKRLRIAVVDDNVDNADLLGKFIAGEGYAVEVFHDAAQALAKFMVDCPDLAILDIGLPVMDGYELAGKIRQVPGGPHCQLIALSGYAHKEARQRTGDGGFQCHLVKPVEPASVIKQIRDLLASPPA